MSRLNIDPGHALELYEDAVARHDGATADTDTVALAGELLDLSEALEAEASSRLTTSERVGPRLRSSTRRRYNAARDAYRRGMRLLVERLVERGMVRSFADGIGFESPSLVVSPSPMDDTEAGAVADAAVAATRERYQSYVDSYRNGERTLTLAMQLEGCAETLYAGAERRHARELADAIRRVLGAEVKS